MCAVDFMTRFQPFHKDLLEGVCVCVTVVKEVFICTASLADISTIKLVSGYALWLQLRGPSCSGPNLHLVEL